METTEVNDGWYIDSGATCHMSGNARAFSRLEKIAKSYRLPKEFMKNVFI